MPDDPDYSMVMPFVVTTDNGGPYEPSAFVAGVYFGEASVLLPLLKFGAMYRRYVPTPLAGQLDLLCMAHEHGVEFWTGPPMTPLEWA